MQIKLGVGKKGVKKLQAERLMFIERSHEALGWCNAADSDAWSTNEMLAVVLET